MHLTIAPMGSRWDIFCRVIDNWGDVGVCWRLARQLASRGMRVRLWLDDASALAWMAPHGHPGVQVLPWPHAVPADGPGEVIVETFGGDIPPSFIAACADAARDGVQKHLWINLEYLSAESYVQRSHLLPSPLLSGPGAGLTRWFFYPGFTERTGGLQREPDLALRQARFDREAWRARHGIAPDACATTLFCYEPPALHAWLDRLAAHGGVHLLATAGRSAAAVRRWQARNAGGGRPLPIAFMPPMPQPAFDELLWAADLNCVRGEDSLVRALWAGRPFVWHIYPQQDDAHHAKLEAFLDWLAAPSSLRRFHRIWNGIGAPAALPAPDAALLAEWRACAQEARARLLAQDDLVTRLLRFVAEKS